MKILPLTTILALLLIMTSFSGCISSYGMQSDTVKPGVLTIAVTPSLPPQQYSENGELKGFDIDLMKEVANKMGLRPEFKAYSYEGAEEALLKGEVDCIPSMTVSPDRKEYLDFSRTYTQTYMVVAVLENSPYDKLTDLNGKNVAVLKDTYSEEWVENYFGSIDANIKYYNTAEEILSDVKSGNLDAVVTDEIHLNYHSENSNIQDKIIPEKVTIVYWAVAMKKDNDGLQEKMNNALLELEKDEAIYELKNKWYD